MAVIQYTGLVTQLRGSIAGTTFSKTKQGFSAYKKGLPRKQKSPAQNAINAGFAANANLWRTLDSTARSNWATMAAAIQVYNRIGELVNISAYNMYQLISALINPTGSGTALTCNGTTDPPYQFSTVLNSIEFESTPTGWQISAIDIDVTTITNQTTSCQIIFWISQPELSEESAARENWYRLAQDTIAGNIGSSETVNFQFSNIQLPPGFKVIPGYFYRIKAQMIQVNSKVFTLGVISPATVATEYEFPFPTLTIATQFDGAFLDVSGGNFLNTAASYFVASPPTGPKSDYELEINYRGQQQGTGSPTYTENTPLGLWNFDTAPSTSTWGFPRATQETAFITELNNSVAPVTTTPSTQYGIFTARIRYVPSNIYSEEFQFFWAFIVS